MKFWQNAAAAPIYLGLTRTFLQPFGIIMVVNMEVGMCHPAVGLNLYVASGITKMGITELTVAVWPWLLAMLGFLLMVTYFPGLSIWFPRLLGMMYDAAEAEAWGHDCTGTVLSDGLQRKLGWI